MQIYAIRMFNFLRFGEDNNSVVFDLTQEHQRLLKEGLTTLDSIYKDVRQDPRGHIKEISKIGITNLMGISGVVGGVHDRSNGVGKSTVLEAICYALYDKVIRKNVNTDKIEKAGTSVATKFDGQIAPHVKETYVELIFEEKGSIYRLKRSRSFSKSKKSHKASIFFDKITEHEVDSQSGHRTKDTNEAILNVINMDYDVFVNSVMFGQKDAGRFLKGTDKVRKEMLINLLHLENVVTGCVEEVRKRKNAKDKDITQFKAQIEVIKENIENHSSIDSLNENIKQIELLIKTVEQNIKELRLQSEALASLDVIQKVKVIKTAGAKVKEDLLECKSQKETQVKEWQSLFSDFDNKEKSQLNKIDTHTVTISNMKNQGKSLKQKINQFEQNDLETKKNDIELAKKLIAKKPEYQEYAKKFEVQKKELLIQKTTIKVTLGGHLDEIKGLTAQVKNANGNAFICEKCKSQVTKDHLEGEINNNHIKAIRLQDDFTKKANELQDIEDKYKKVLERLDKINDSVLKESQATNAIKEYESDKVQITELQQRYKAELASHIEFEKELVDTIAKKETYNKKIILIGEQCDSKINKLQEEINVLGQQLVSLNKDASVIEEKIQAIGVKIKLASNEKDGYNAKIGSLTKEIETINQDKKKLIKLEQNTGEQMALYNRLVMLDDIFGLEGVQTRIIQKYLPLLNVYIKEMLDILTDGEMSAELYINNRSHVDINLNGNVGDTFDMVSGGEQEDVRLAMSIGLALLSFSRSAQKPEMICLDEIFGSLDDARVSSVFKLLALLKDKFGRVIVISHKSTINAQLPNQLLLEKGAGVRGMSRIKGINYSSN